MKLVNFIPTRDVPRRMYNDDETDLLIYRSSCILFSIIRIYLYKQTQQIIKNN